MAQAVLPAIDATRALGVADVVLVGFASIGALLPEAASRFGTEISVLGGGVTKIGETPVARFRLGITGDRTDAALGWLAERGAFVRRCAAWPAGRSRPRNGRPGVVPRRLAGCSLSCPAR